MAFFGLRSGPDGSGRAVGFICFLFAAKQPSILDPFRTKFDVFGPGPNFGQPGLDLGRSWPTLADLGDLLWLAHGASPLLTTTWAEAYLWADIGPTLGRLWADFGPTLGQLWADLWLTFGGRAGGGRTPSQVSFPDVYYSKNLASQMR